MDKRAASHPSIPSAFMAALFALYCAPVMANGVEAGTLIENTAQATFDTAQGSQTVQSNTVTLRVDEVLDVAIASLDSGAINIDTQSVILTFRLSNLMSR